MRWKFAPLVQVSTVFERLIFHITTTDTLNKIGLDMHAKLSQPQIGAGSEASMKASINGGQVNSRRYFTHICSANSRYGAVEEPTNQGEQTSGC